MRIDGTQIIKGTRTNCSNGKKSEVELSYSLKAGSNYVLWFYIVSGGVTGYESFEFNPESINRLKETGWSACAGTKDRWDSLFIPAEEMAKAIDDICEQYTKGDKEAPTVYCPREKKEVPIWYCLGSLTQNRLKCPDLVKATVHGNEWAKVECKSSPERILVKGLADIASNLGRGSFIPSREDDEARPLRIKASETLKEAGYNYYECCGKDNIDGWFTEEELQDLKDER